MQLHKNKKPEKNSGLQRGLNRWTRDTLANSVRQTITLNLSRRPKKVNNFKTIQANDRQLRKKLKC